MILTTLREGQYCFLALRRAHVLENMAQFLLCLDMHPNIMMCILMS